MAGKNRNQLYSWDEINASLMDAGYSCRQILSVLKALRNGRKINAPKYLMQHQQWNSSDYEYLNAKGYSNPEIKAIWDRDANI